MVEEDRREGVAEWNLFLLPYNMYSEENSRQASAIAQSLHSFIWER